MKAVRLALSVLLLSASLAHSQGTTPIALTAHVDALGRGLDGTVVGVVFQIAPEDRQRAGDRLRVVTTLRSEGEIVDRQSAVVVIEADGTAMLYREWDPGSYELQIAIGTLDGTIGGVWFGDIEVPESLEPFEAPDGAPIDAIALDLTPPSEGAVTFRPPPNLGGLGAIQLVVDAPENTTSVEFFNDGASLGRRNRAPWTVSIPLGDILKRTQISAIAYDADGNYIGEDALVLNSPSGQIGVQILLAPDIHHQGRHAESHRRRQRRQGDSPDPTPSRCRDGRSMGRMPLCDGD